MLQGSDDSTVKVKDRRNMEFFEAHKHSGELPKRVRRDSLNVRVEMEDFGVETQYPIAPKLFLAILYLRAPKRGLPLERTSSLDTLHT